MCRPSRRFDLKVLTCFLDFDRARLSGRAQGQKFVAVLKAKNRGAATSQNVKNRGIVAAKIVKIAAMSRQNRENREFFAANILIIAAF